MIDKETLEKHLDSGLNMSQISRIYNVSPTAVKKWMQKYDLYTRRIAYNGHNPCKKEYRCLYCKDEMKSKSKYVTTYCSMKCQHDHVYDIFIEEWQSGKIDGTTKTGASNTIRRYLFKKYDNKCSRCDWGETNEFTGNIPLELEHIDGNSENNVEENLTLLCPCCHSLTATYKGANKGKGRHYRRQRYKDGKSY